MLPRKEGQTEPYALEDMISDLQTRRNSLDHDEGDPSELLKQRERDLVLAAELGKALLERNQELTKQIDTLAEEYASKLEVSWFLVHMFPYDNDVDGESFMHINLLRFVSFRKSCIFLLCFQCL